MHYFPAKAVPIGAKSENRSGPENGRWFLQARKLRAAAARLDVGASGAARSCFQRGRAQEALADGRRIKLSALTQEVISA